MKPLDMADKYDSYADAPEEDDEPTIRMVVPYPRPYAEEKRYPGVGLLIVIGSALLFWGAVAFIAVRFF